jgi:thioredoxin-related protein
MVVGQNNTNQQEESVYNLIPRSEVRASKSFRYILIHHFSVYLNHISNSYESKFKQNVRESFKGGKHEHRTMGYAEEPVPDPQQFLKKHQNDTKQTVSNDRKYFFFLFLKNNFLFDKS